MTTPTEKESDKETMVQYNIRTNGKAIHALDQMGYLGGRSCCYHQLGDVRDEDEIAIALNVLKYTLRGLLALDPHDPHLLPIHYTHTIQAMKEYVYLFEQVLANDEEYKRVEKKSEEIVSRWEQFYEKEQGEKKESAK